MWQVQNCELCGLATFNENCYEYRTYIKSAIKLWLDRGVDALRVDTVKHMPVWFWQEFNADIRAHKPEAFIFGEWIYNQPTNPISTDFVNHSGMTILDFAFCQAMRFAIAEGQGFKVLQDVLDKDNNYNGSTELVTFIDNHDMPRFQSLNSDPGLLKIAIIVLMCSRGIPCIFYGTEQYLHDDTEGGNDPYNRPLMVNWDVNTDIYKYIRLLSYARKKNLALALGGQWPKLVTDNVYAFCRRYRTCRCFVAVNKGDEKTTLTNIDTELPDGQYQCQLTRRKFWIKDKIIDQLVLAPKEGVVLNFVGPTLESQAVVRVQLNGVPTQPNDVVVVIGNCPELGNWNIDDGVPLEFINSNTWFGEIPVEETAGKPVIYKYAIRRPGSVPIRENIVCRRWVLPTEGDVKWRDTWKGESMIF
jgi:cyclomaltodextrin glucanotransferase